MNVRIIKRAERIKVTNRTSSFDSQTKNSDPQITIATTVKSWIVERRQKNEAERLAVKALFGK